MSDTMGYLVVPRVEDSVIVTLKLAPPDGVEVVNIVEKPLGTLIQFVPQHENWVVGQRGDWLTGEGGTMVFEGVHKELNPLLKALGMKRVLKNENPFAQKMFCMFFRKSNGSHHVIKGVEFGNPFRFDVQTTVTHTLNIS